MSDARAKQERSRAKDARQTPAPDGPSTGSKRKRPKKPWIIEEMYVYEGKHNIFKELGLRKEWRKVKAYAKKKDAEVNLKRLKQGHFSQYFVYRLRKV